VLSNEAGGDFTSDCFAFTGEDFHLVFRGGQFTLQFWG
jgi:hypothetical protein